MELEGRKTGGKGISQNTLSIENMYVIRASTEVMKVEEEMRRATEPGIRELGD